MSAEREAMPRLTWYGHAAFLIEDTLPEGTGVRVMLDPYRAPDVGSYGAIDDVADIVAVSHENAKYHSHLPAAKPRHGVDGVTVVDGLALLDTPQPAQYGGIPFTAVRVWENDEREEPIAMLGLSVGGVRFLHMGDCGHALSPEEVAACGEVDVLLALAGGPPTLKLPDLVRFISDLKPRVVVPMHYLLADKIDLKIRPVDDLLGLLPLEMPVRRFDSSTVELRPEALPDATEVWVLPPAR